MDVHELNAALADAGINIDPDIGNSLGGLLLCFGDIEVDVGWGDRLPADTPEQHKAKMLLKIALEDRAKALEER